MLVVKGCHCGNLAALGHNPFAKQCASAGESVRRACRVMDSDTPCVPSAQCTISTRHRSSNCKPDFSKVNANIHGASRRGVANQFVYIEGKSPHRRQDSAHEASELTQVSTVVRALARASRQTTSLVSTLSYPRVADACCIGLVTGRQGLQCVIHVPCVHVLSAHWPTAGHGHNFGIAGNPSVASACMSDPRIYEHGHDCKYSGY